MAENTLKMDKIAVLIPCFNEVQTIEKVVTDFKKELPEAVIYVYDNNSVDGTAEIAGKAGAVVRYEYQQGKGNVIRRMFREIDAHCYVMIDGDDTYPADNVREMVDLVLNKTVELSWVFHKFIPLDVVILSYIRGIYLCTLLIVKLINQKHTFRKSRSHPCSSRRTCRIFRQASGHQYNKQRGRNTFYPDKYKAFRT